MAVVSTSFPEPTRPIANRADVLVGYLDFFRARTVEKVAALPEAKQRVSRLASGWTPLELVRHLTFVERRWLVWGFLGQDIGDPFGDTREDRWWVGADEAAELVLSELREQGLISARIVAEHDLNDVGAPGPRWEGNEPATLERVLLHLLQEHARHLGHLDVVVELEGGERGE